MDSNTNGKSNSDQKLNINKNTVGETCVICEQKKENGIHIYTQFICNECEQEIISTETNNEKYKYYLNQLKKVIEPTLYAK
ncbi:MAG TPA: carnitine--CoA ligase [Bacillus bacterium]|nr:carnitine--CoA ligase [Bacillus sp. (in: firmicutes)]